MFTCQNILTQKLGLVWFYCISTKVGYSIPNMVYSFMVDICFVNKLIKLNSSKYCYVSLTIQLNLSHLLYTQLKDQTVLFGIGHLFTLSLNVKQFYLTH